MLRQAGYAVDVTRCVHQFVSILGESTDRNLTAQVSLAGFYAAVLEWRFSVCELCRFSVFSILFGASTHQLTF